ncbi:MAG: hypothetical protein K2W92_07320, partial [Alphaproteobacteria bacterium]|nr:hypothetical protein [Alphaproteobacteria bacterium]
MIKKFAFALGVTSILGDSQSAYALVSKNNSFEDEHLSSIRRQPAPTKRISGKVSPWKNPSAKLPRMREKAPFSEQLKNEITHIGSVYHRVLVFPTNKEMQRNLRMQKKSMREELKKQKRNSIRLAILKRKRARAEAKSTKRIARMLRKKKRNETLRAKKDHKIAMRKLKRQERLERLKLRKNKKRVSSFVSRKRVNSLERMASKKRVLALKKRLITHLAQQALDPQLTPVQQGGKPIQPSQTLVAQRPVKEFLEEVSLVKNEKPALASHHAQPDLSKGSAEDNQSLRKAESTLTSGFSLHPVSAIGEGMPPQAINRGIKVETNKLDTENLQSSINDAANLHLLPSVAAVMGVQAEDLLPAGFATTQQAEVNAESIQGGSLLESSRVLQETLTEDLVGPTSPQAGLSLAVVEEEATPAQDLHVNPVIQLFDEAVKWVESQVESNGETQQNAEALEEEPSALQRQSTEQAATLHLVTENNEEDIRQEARPSELTTESLLGVDSPIAEEENLLESYSGEFQEQVVQNESAAENIILSQAEVEAVTQQQNEAVEKTQEVKLVSAADLYVVRNEEEPVEQHA